METLAARYASLAATSRLHAADYRALSEDPYLANRKAGNLEAAARHEAQAAEYDRLAGKVAA